MLSQVCDYVHNYFVKDEIAGDFTVADGVMSVPGLMDGQRFRIRGSALNDGIYTYYAAGVRNDDNTQAANLLPETFTGVVDAMAVPRAVLDLVGEITAWVTANQAVLDSPYQSESFGGYSYTKASGSGANGGGIGWQDKFKSRLNAYRKIA